MKTVASDAYRCPVTREVLVVKDNGRCLRSASGRSYPITDDVVDFTHGLTLSPTDENARRGYDLQAGEYYENAMSWIWQAFHEDELKVRSALVDLLDPKEDQRILEIGCGSGADSEILAKRMKKGILFLQDVSNNMLRRCKSRLDGDPTLGPELIYQCSVSLTAPLPFSDGYFDGVFHFGGLNTFNDIALSLSEMARVTRVGGRVVVGDESLAPWLRESEYGRIIINSNKLCDAQVPLDKLPICARDVSLRFIIGNAYYVITFKVGEGVPEMDLDLPHKGRRGGTLRTRYFGQLEGVTLEAKRLATSAAATTGKSVHNWLDEVVRGQAEKDLGHK